MLFPIIVPLGFLFCQHPGKRQAKTGIKNMPTGSCPSRRVCTNPVPTPRITAGSGPTSPTAKSTGSALTTKTIGWANSPFNVRSCPKGLEIQKTKWKTSNARKMNHLKLTKRIVEIPSLQLPDGKTRANCQQGGKIKSSPQFSGRGVEKGNR